MGCLDEATGPSQWPSCGNQEGPFLAEFLAKMVQPVSCIFTKGETDNSHPQHWG